MRHINNQAYKKYLEKAFPGGFELIVAPDYTEQFNEKVKEQVDNLSPESRSTISTFSFTLSVPFFTVYVKPEKTLEFFDFLIHDENSKVTQVRGMGAKNEGRVLREDEFEALLKEGRELEIFFDLYSPSHDFVMRVETKLDETIFHIIYLFLVDQIEPADIEE